MNKKYIALAAALIMLLCLLCACGKDDDTKTPEETGTPPAVSTDDPTAQQRIVNYLDSRNISYEEVT